MSRARGWAALFTVAWVIHQNGGAQAAKFPQFRRLGAHVSISGASGMDVPILLSELGCFVLGCVVALHVVRHRPRVRDGVLLFGLAAVVAALVGALHRSGS